MSIQDRSNAEIAGSLTKLTEVVGMSESTSLAYEFGAYSCLKHLMGGEYTHVTSSEIEGLGQQAVAEFLIRAVTNARRQGIEVTIPEYIDDSNVAYREPNSISSIDILSDSDDAEPRSTRIYRNSPIIPVPKMKAARSNRG